MAVYALTETTAYEPIDLPSAKAYLQVPDSVTASDDVIEMFIAAAKEYVQRYTSRLIGEYEVVEYFDAWPIDQRYIFRLKFGLATSIDLVETFDGTDWNTVDAEDYSADVVGRPARVKMLDIGDYDLGDGISLIRITYTAGSPTGADMAKPLVAMMYQLIGFWFSGGLDQDISDLNYVHQILKQYTFNR